MEHRGVDIVWNNVQARGTWCGPRSADRRVKPARHDTRRRVRRRFVGVEDVRRRGRNGAAVLRGRAPRVCDFLVYTLIRRDAVDVAVAGRTGGGERRPAGEAGAAGAVTAALDGERILHRREANRARVRAEDVRHVVLRRGAAAKGLVELCGRGGVRGRVLQRRRGGVRDRPLPLQDGWSGRSTQRGRAGRSARGGRIARRGRPRVVGQPRRRRRR
mmetsp:Transcript_8761/g.30147  ORF Transcript_8761/g.30147 Transcript_8761/m.30147 type:complete len:216 (+) Transcript_8761:115-762(+)